MDLDVVLQSGGVLIVSAAGIVTAWKAESARKAAKKGTAESDEISSKVDVVVKAIERLDCRIVSLQDSVTEHFEWHLKERYRHDRG